MKTLTIQVPDGVYSVYTDASILQQQKAELEISNLLKILFRKKIGDDLNANIASLRNEASENGLTDNILNEILAKIDNERTAGLCY